VELQGDVHVVVGRYGPTERRSVLVRFCRLLVQLSEKLLAIVGGVVGPEEHPDSVCLDAGRDNKN